MRARHPERAELPTQTERLPHATIKRRWRFSPIWLVPLAVAGFVGWLVYRTYLEGGPKLTIRFKDGKGIEEGKTMLKYRGVRVGDVTGLKLSKDLKYLEVQAQLDGSAANLARAGSRFWIVRPEVSVSGISGLQTIVSGNYIQVEPGQGGKTNEFFGLEAPPAVLPEQAHGLRLVLLTSRLRSINVGTPVFYHGIQVGEAGNNRLSADAQTVEIDLYIRPQFAPLVREKSCFWNSGGIDVNVGLFGLYATSHDVRTMLTGGLSFATPNEPGATARNGTTFRLYDKPQDEWLAWAPAIKLSAGRTNIIEQTNQ